MSEDVAITLRNVSKKFSLFRSPLDRMIQAMPFGGKQRGCDFWALRDISWTVPRGATVGIIGRNGSGKSTLLQIICSILQPTSGTVSVQGQVSALLELGAGFNPAFTGRANVLLHGAMKGLSQREVRKRLPRIEAFAEIGSFIDQPVKSYSSGMFVRLAFAAAINDDPEILIVDEALAVGDAKFQHKCYEKFLEFQRAGKTILFVTHDAQAVVKHCHHAVLLEDGRLLASGEPKVVTGLYRELLFAGTVNPCQRGAGSDGQLGQNKAATEEVQDPEQSPLERFLSEIPNSDQCPARRSYYKNELRFGDRRGEILDYLVVCGDEQDPATVLSGDVVDVYLKIRFHRPVDRPIIGYGVKTVDGLLIYGTNTRMQEVPVAPGRVGEVRVFRFSLRLALPAGDCFLTLGLAEQPHAQDFQIDSRQDLIHLQVHHPQQFTGLVNLEAKLEEIAPVLV